ncbi:MAG: ribonuclease HII [Zetaproteobacteria bacterium]|nr:ribonuclease HII [Zetaproteobacteria bacterium]
MEDLQIQERGTIDRELWAQHRVCAGVDEVGRGCLAGPVVAAAVVLHGKKVEQISALTRAKLRDSKTLSLKQREEMAELIETELALAHAVSFATAREVEQYGIVGATQRAMQTALLQLDIPVDLTLVDGNQTIQGWAAPQKTLVKGDNLSWSIAAASILAKVCRDRWMVQADSHYPGYGFAKHVGYGTAAHRQALQELGPCVLHRRNFAPIRQMLHP